MHIVNQGLKNLLSMKQISFEDLDDNIMADLNIRN